MESEKVLRALLDHPWSTSSRLAASAAVNERTVKTVLQRNRAALESRTAKSGRGRPPMEFRVKEAWFGAIEARARLLEPLPDPLDVAIQIVEDAEAAMRRAESDDARRHVLHLATIQSEVAREAIKNVPTPRLDLQLRLVGAENQLIAAYHRQEILPVAHATAAYAAMEAATQRPPRRAWEKWYERVKQLAEEFGAVWLPGNEPSRAAPMAMFIDGIRRDSDAVSAEVVTTLRDAGVPLVCFQSRNFQSKHAKKLFYGELDDLINDPISCLAPLYMTFDSSDSSSREICEQIEGLGKRNMLGNALATAQEAIADAAHSNRANRLEMSQQTAFYNAFVANAAVGTSPPADSASLWSVCRGPALLDMAADGRLENFASRLKCMYVHHAGDVDVKPLIVKWIHAAPMASIGEPLQTIEF